MAPKSSNLEQQSAHTLMATSASVVIGFLLSITLSRRLGPAGKGMLDLTSASAGLFVLVLGGSLNASLTQLVARRGGTPTGLTWQLAAWAAAAGGLTAALLFGLPDLCTGMGLLPGHDRVFWSAFVSLTVGAGVYGAGLRGILIGRHAVITANRIDIVLKGALLAAYLILTFALPANARYFALAGLGAAVALPLAVLPALRGSPVPAAGTWATLAAMTLPIHGTNIVHFINQRADIFFVQAFHGPVEVALYALAVSLAQCVLLLSSALAQPLLPRVAAAASPTEAGAHTAEACRLFLVLAVAAAVALAVSGVWLVPLLFGRDFSGSLPSLLVLLPGMIGFGLTNILISHFVGLNRGRVNLVISFIGLAVTVTGNLTLTRTYGAIGAAATSTAAYSLAGLLSLGLFARESRIALHRIILPDLETWRALPRLVTRFRP